MKIEAKEIQIRDFPDIGKILVLICDNKTQMDLLWQLMGDGDNYKVRIYVHKKTNNISIGIAIKSIGSVLRVNSIKNEDNYPPVKWLLSGQVSFLTTGYLNDKRELMHTDLKPLNSLIQPGQQN
jgi:hypothetical protein